MAYACGRLAHGRRAGLIAAFMLAAYPFANMMSRAFDVHVPRMTAILGVFASLLAYRRFGRLIWLAPGGAFLLFGLALAPSVSDAPLFALGIAGPVGAVAAGGLARLAGERTLTFSIAVAALLGGVWILYAVYSASNPAFNIAYVLREAWTAPANATIFDHVKAYPVYLTLRAVGFVGMGLALAAVHPAWKAETPGARLWMAGVLVPLILLTVVAKKNGYYAGIMLPYLAVGTGIGLAPMTVDRRWFSLLVFIAVLAGCVRESLELRHDALPRRPWPAFQSVPEDAPQYPSKFTLSQRDDLLEILRRVCKQPAVPCRVAIAGIVPDEQRVVAPAARAYPELAVSRILHPRAEAGTGGPFDVLVLNPSAFGPTPDDNFVGTFGAYIHYTDTAAVADAIERAIHQNGHAADYLEHPGAALQQALAGMTPLETKNRLFYYIRPDAGGTP
ncbi:MAG: hypothetical protein M5R36_11760 [Deltaproteobacteria bacterium]|nr:hypothetical protein [Deltaproteobacteria bacterium]